MRSRCLAVALAVAGLLCVSTAAEARAVPWGGTGANDLGPASLLLSANDGRVSVSSLQVVMACTDTSDGTESSRAFSVSSNIRVALRRNRFSFDFTATSGGRVGRVRLSGTLGSNGRGTARATVDATGTDEGTGGIIERCQSAVNFRLRRGRA
ncbi:MAG: hypothetical protein JHC84_17860 [Solirubrobacteraceae bacterium]|nr:hypothetical protein [Solirubrobacteraceae bacterium]